MWDINSRADHGTALAGRGVARGSAAAVVALTVPMDFLACLAGASDSATGGRWLVRMEDTAEAWRACEEGSLGLGAEMGVVRFEGGLSYRDRGVAGNVPPPATGAGNGAGASSIAWRRASNMLRSSALPV